MPQRPPVRRALGLAAACLLSLRAGAAEPAARRAAFEAVFGPRAESGWNFTSGTLEAPPNPRPGHAILSTGKAPVVFESKRAAAGAQQLHALIRLRTDQFPNVRADFQVGRQAGTDAGFHMVVSADRGGEAVACQVQHNGKPLHAAALAKHLDWDPTPGNSFTYYPRAYSLKDIRPGWPEDFRVRIEHDMARLPDVPDKWLGVRIERREGEVRFWLDDRLVGVKAGPDVHAGGLTRLELSPAVELAALTVRQWQPTPGFEPLHLEGYANGHAFLDHASVRPDALPAGRPATVGGVPFFFPRVNAEGNDHIDVSRSLYRQANLEGYMPSYEQRWAGSARRDPCRIQLRVPNGAYDTLYLIAACDDRPDHIHRLTAMFFRPAAGFAESFTASVPLATATAAARPVPVTLSNGRRVNLWLVEMSLDPGRLSAFADMDIVEVELTKQVHLFRSYPDPFLYGWHQGGRPAAVHVYAATLGRAPVAFDWQPSRFGHVWTAPAVPGYTATLTNHAGRDLQGKLTVTTRSHDGTETTRQERDVRLPKGAVQRVEFACPVKLNGYHEITATLAVAGKTWTEKRSFVRLAPDTRAPRWTEGKGALFGYWSYHGGHYTPKADRHIELMTAAGARTSIGAPNPNHPLVKQHWAPVSAGAWEVAPQDWARQDPPDPKKYAEYQKAVALAFTNARKGLPPALQPDHVYFFPEPHVSTRLTEGNYPTYWNAPEYQLTPQEKENLRVFFTTAKCAAEAVRRQWPRLKILVPWGDALFIVPLLRAGFPKGLIDGSGIDTPGFERLPEMQLHQIAVHRLYELRKEFAKAGIPNPRLQYCEGIFVPTEPGAVSWREQMDIYNRWVLISMAYGVERFYSGWFAFDCGNYYGSEHYGGCGIQRRIPYCDPKPAYAAYATMTDRLDQANFDGWLRTGSLNTYCLRFKGPKGHVYTLWTIRGKRPVTLTLAADGDVHVTDAMSNTRTVASKGRRVTVVTDPSVVCITGPEVVAVAAGEPDHADARPAQDARQVADLGDGSWRYTSERDRLYEHGTFALMRYPGKFRGEVIADPVHGHVLRSTLLKQDAVRELMPWYNTLVPRRPVALSGAPAALGLWVKGAGDWGRVIYVLRDAGGQRWTSIGTQDQYNCDDVHSWSAFNFDGWRYVRFELPGHTGYDNFRKHGTTWWRSDGGDGVVRLPLALERIIVEQRSHVLYVNDVQPAPSNAVCFGKLFVEYAAPRDATAEAVRIANLRMPLPAGAPDLPNPIADMQRSGTGPATVITRLAPPLERNDGTLVHVYFREVPGAKAYAVWVSAHPDGRGAVNMTPGGAKDGVLVGGLRPAVRFYFWVTYQDAAGKPSRPSAAASATLVDAFQEK